MALLGVEWRYLVYQQHLLRFEYNCVKFWLYLHIESNKLSVMTKLNRI